MNQTASVLERFARVHGSGIFYIDDFCALTGSAPEEVAPLLHQEEISSGRVLKLAPGMYILKPSAIIRKKKLWYDWKFNPTLQRQIFDACQASWNSSIELQSATGINITTLKRYLKAMENSGNLTFKRINRIKYYQAASWKPLSTYRKELFNHKAPGSI